MKQGKLQSFLLEYRGEVLFRNRPDGRYGVKGRVKNKIEIGADGTILLDFYSDVFPLPPIAEQNVYRAAEMLERLSLFADGYVSRFGVSKPPYLDYVTNYVLFSYADNRALKLVLDDMNEGGMSALKAVLRPFLAKRRLRLDVGERLPQGVFGYIQVRTEKSPREYSYFGDEETISPGDEVLVPFGEENEKVRGTVVSVEYFRGSDGPYPPELVKRIIEAKGKQSPPDEIKG